MLTYETAHSIVRRLRGRASDRPCLHCDIHSGRHADEWAYGQEDLSPLWGIPKGKTNVGPSPYSADPKQYIPLCRPCHRIFDAPQACFRGHPWTDENTHINTNGNRQCRECGRMRDRERYRRDGEKIRARNNASRARRKAEAHG